MARYYRWRKNNAVWSAVSDGSMPSSFSNGTTIKILSSQPPISSSGYFEFYSGTSVTLSTSNPTYTIPQGTWVSVSGNNLVAYAYYAQVETKLTKSSFYNGFTTSPGLKHYEAEQIAGTFVSYVYSTNASAYPNDGVQGDYYYDQRTEVISPTEPGKPQYPNPITTPEITVSWEPAISNIPEITIKSYSVSYSEKEEETGAYLRLGSTNGQNTSLTVKIPAGITGIRLMITAKDTDGKVSQAFGDFVPVNIAPSTPGSITVPGTVIEGQTVSVSWAAQTGATEYVLQRNTGGGWIQVYSGSNTSFSEPVRHWPRLQYQVQAKNTYGSSGWKVSSAITVLLSPALTIPTLAMQGQSIPVSWTAVDGATGYTLQRKANTDADWVQVYSGNALTFTETVGTWTTVQYQVQAVFSVGPGGWGTSKVIPVMSASALVISGQDEDLGLITHDVPYTVSTDTGNPISLNRTVNGVQMASLTVENGFAYDIPVMDLPTGEGTIVLSASVNTSGGSPVTATRTWTYTKTAFSFPNTGSTAQLQQEGKNVFPATLAECVRVGANLGGDLGHALEMIAPSILNGAKIETGSYVGTGTYGESSPNKLTFNFNPTVVYITSNDSRSIMVFGLWINGLTYGPVILPNDTSIPSNNIIQWGENEVSWYVSSEASSGDYYQLNKSGCTYLYCAIG